MRRFWKQVSLEQGTYGHGIRLDARALKTPMRKALKLNPGHVPATEDAGRFLTANGMWAQLLELVKLEIANAAGTTKDQMADMARAVSSTVGTQGKAAEVLALMAGSGSVARADLQKFTTTAIQMERVLGVAVEDTADKFAALAKEPLAASLKLNQGTNYLTASVYEQIRALVAQGKAAEAASLAQNTFADAMANMTVVMVDEADNNKELGRAKGTALMDNPLNAAIWLARELKKDGITLKKGDLLSLGGFFPPQPTKEGMKIRMQYLGLPGDPTVAVEFN